MSKLDHIKANRKKVIPPVLILIIIGAIIYLNFFKPEVLLGQAEATILTHSAEVSGKIIESPVDLGQEVKAGDVLAVIDSKDLQYALDQLNLSLEKALIASADANKGQGSRTQSSIAAAQAAVNGASATASKANQDYQKSLTLYQDGAISESALEAAKLQADTANSAFAAAKAQLDLARSSSAGSISESSSIDILILENKIAQQEDLIKKCTITATCDGIIMSKNYGLGDIVSPGYNIADIASASEKYLVTYYPKELIYDIHYDQQVSILYQGETFACRIKYIDVKPQFTPIDLQTSANKNKESVKVKILLPEGCPIKPGETVEIEL